MLRLREKVSQVVCGKWKIGKYGTSGNYLKIGEMQPYNPCDKN